MLAVQFAVYSLFPVEPLVIVTFSVTTSNPVPVHPANVYPSLVGLFNVISSDSIVYVPGFVCSPKFPPAKS